MVRARSRERDWDMRDTGPGSREGAAGTERAPHLATTKTRDILASSRTRSVIKRISIRTSRVLCARDCLQWTTLIPSQSTLWVSSDHHRPRSASDMIPLSPGIIALSPTQLVTPGLSPSWSPSPSAWRWADPAAPREGDMSELWEFGPGREKKQDTVAETRRERRAVEDVTWHMTWARCQAPESAQSPVVTRISWLLSAQWLGNLHCWWVPSNWLPLNSRPRLIIAVTQAALATPADNSATGNQGWGGL